MSRDTSAINFRDHREETLDPSLVIDPASVAAIQPSPQNGDGDRRDEAGLIDGMIPQFVNPFAGAQVDPRIGGDKPFLQLAVEAFCIMFWPSERREAWMNENNISFGEDPILAVYEDHGRAHIGPNATPMGNGANLASAPNVSRSPHVTATYENADELYTGALRAASLEMNEEFRVSGANPTGDDTETVAAVNREYASTPALV